MRPAVALCGALACPLLLAVAGCLGSTGGELVEFEAFAAGPEGAVRGEPYLFENQRGYLVRLDKASLRIGAVYLNRSSPTSVAQDTSCYLSGTYIAEVPAGLDVDVLDPELQPFPIEGFATTERATTAEIWLTGGPIDAESDPTVIAQVMGVASKDGEDFPFEGTITISENRVVAASDPALPGANPICKQRIVTPIAVDVTPADGGSLLVRVDPADWFQNVEFDLLEEVSPGSYRFRDDSEDQPSRNLYNGIRANAGVYTVTFE
jgi:hypothetical protein